MLDSNITEGDKNQNQHQLSISDGSLHNKKYPFLKEFSELIDDMSTKDLKDNLLTNSQKMLAESLWMSNKSKKELYPALLSNNLDLLRTYGVIKVEKII